MTGWLACGTHSLTGSAFRSCLSAVKSKVELSSLIEITYALSMLQVASVMHSRHVILPAPKGYQQRPYDSMQVYLLQTAHPSVNACRMVEAEAAFDKAAVHSTDMQGRQFLVEAAAVEAALPQPQDQVISKAKKALEGTTMSPSRLDRPPIFPSPFYQSSLCTPLLQPCCKCPHLRPLLYISAHVASWYASCCFACANSMYPATHCVHAMSCCHARVLDSAGD